MILERGQLLVILLIEAAMHHNTHQVRQSLLNNIPIPRRQLRISHHDVRGHPHTLGSSVRSKKLLRQSLLIQKEWQIPMLAIDSNSREHLAGPRRTDGQNTVRTVLGVSLIRGQVSNPTMRSLFFVWKDEGFWWYNYRKYQIAVCSRIRHQRCKISVDKYVYLFNMEVLSAPVAR